MSTISIITAVDEKNAIGKKQQLLWNLPYDMQRFKGATTGHAVVMGRRTFESLPKGALPNRKNIVLTTSPPESFVDVFVCNSMQDALELCEKEDEIFMIGGAMVYKSALDIADKLYLTRVHHVFEDADIFFPEINFDEWEEIETERDHHPADERHAHSYTFHTYLRKK
ncbi:MAG: dihydrofolate reductase [Tannerellaceae bacterium]|jgi:dihydrofolate reductase|nr:dihydrofolate reductase [Tannerellaceae bacterium]